MGLTGVQQQPGTGCHCKKEDYFEPPIKTSKMKVFKKIKKKIGLTPRTTTSCPGPNNLPPLKFHQVHGDNVRICRDGTMAKRYESFCKGIAFSARPVKTNERVCVKFSEISNNWSGVIRFGFTYNDPATLRNTLPKYACPDLTNRPGFWAKALNERFCERDNILTYYVTAAGDVHFGVNGEEKGVFITGVETRGPLWTLIDIYGNCSMIEFLDSRMCFYHNPTTTSNPYPRSIVATANAEPEVERLQSAFQSMNVANEEQPQQIVTRPCAAVNRDANVATPTAGSSGNEPGMLPVPFHRTKGRNVQLSSDRFVATREDSEFCQGYVFTARPLKIGEKIFVQILRTEHMYVGALALGLTSCDPATLQPTDLPDDSDILLDRPEYWVVSKDVAATPKRGDEIMFCVTAAGEVLISKNRGPPSVVMHVDQSLQLWAFLDVYGSTQSVRILSQSTALPMSPSRRLHVQLPSSESVNSLNSQMSLQQMQLQHNQQAEMKQRQVQIAAAQAAVAAAASSRVISVPAQSSDMIQIQPGGTVLVVNLPPTHSSVSDISQQCGSSRLLATPVPSQNGSATMLSSYSNAYIEPISSVQLQQSSTNNYGGSIAHWQDPGAANLTTGAECTICYENPIDSVLYMCGHMCMCYECAIQQWRGIGGGHCPLCRAVIRDVIRTYKS